MNLELKYDVIMPRPTSPKLKIQTAQAVMSALRYWVSPCWGRGRHPGSLQLSPGNPRQPVPPRASGSTTSAPPCPHIQVGLTLTRESSVEETTRLYHDVGIVRDSAVIPQFVSESHQNNFELWSLREFGGIILRDLTCQVKTSVSDPFQKIASSAKDSLLLRVSAQ